MFPIRPITVSLRAELAFIEAFENAVEPLFLLVRLGEVLAQALGHFRGVLQPVELALHDLGRLLSTAWALRAPTMKRSRAVSERPDETERS